MHAGINIKRKTPLPCINSADLALTRHLGPLVLTLALRTVDTTTTRTNSHAMYNALNFSRQRKEP